METLLNYISELNWLAVAVATTIGFAVNAIWYSEKGFKEPWRKSIGLKQKDIQSADMVQPVILSLVGMFVTATALGVLVAVLDLTSVWQGATFGILVALAFLTTNKLMQSQSELRPLSYNVVTLGADVVSLAIMAALLAVWK